MDPVITEQPGRAHPLARHLDGFLTGPASAGRSAHTRRAYRGDLIASAARALDCVPSQQPEWRASGVRSRQPDVRFGQCAVRVLGGPGSDSRNPRAGVRFGQPAVKAMRGAACGSGYAAARVFLVDAVHTARGSVARGRPRSVGPCCLWFGVEGSSGEFGGDRSFS